VWQHSISTAASTLHSFSWALKTHLFTASFPPALSQLITRHCTISWSRCVHGQFPWWHCGCLVKTREAPVRNFCRRRSRMDNQWLSSEATEAKRESRRLECKFTWLHTTASYDAYKAACTTANELVMRSRGQFIANEVADVSGYPRLLWCTVNRLLHPGNACCSYGGRQHDADAVSKTQSAAHCHRGHSLQSLTRRHALTTEH